MLDALAGEKIDFNDWELVDVREANGESIEDWANSLIKPKKSSIERLADFIKSAPNKESRLDKDYYKGIGINPSVEEMKYKNPATYVIKKNRDSNNYTYT